MSSKFRTFEPSIRNGTKINPKRVIYVATWTVDIFDLPNIAVIPDANGIGAFRAFVADQKFLNENAARLSTPVTQAYEQEPLFLGEFTSI